MPDILKVLIAFVIVAVVAVAGCGGFFTYIIYSGNRKNSREANKSEL